MLMKNGLGFGLLGVGIVALVVGGCQSNSGGESPKAGGKTPVHIAFITNGTDAFWTIAKKGIDKETQEDPAVTVDFRELPSGSPAEQKQELDNELIKGVQGIAISVKTPSEQVDMVNAAAAKALVFTQDSDAPDTNRACYVGTNNVDAGRQAGEEIKKALPDGGKIMLFVGAKDSTNAKDRYQGVADALKGSKVTILGIRTDDADRVRAKANAADTMVANPDIACLVGLWSYNGPAIVNVVRDAHKVGKVKIVCFDEDAETLGGIKDGSISATVVQQPFEFGYQACKRLADAIRGDKSVIPPTKQVFIPTRVITKDNVDAFWADLKKLTGKS